MIGRFGFLLGLMFYAACFFAWNHRATRIRANLIAASTPPPHWLARWVLAPVDIVVFCIIPAVAMWCGIENIQGALRWNRLSRDLIAQGERLDIKEIFPPPVPDPQNFAATPLFAELFKSAPADSRNVPSTSYSNAVEKFSVFRLPDRYLPNRANDDTSPYALDEWAVAFENARAHHATNVVLRDDCPSYPQPPPGSDATAQVLKSLSIADDTLAVLCRDIRRPYSRFPARWAESYFELTLPHLEQIKRLHRHLNLRIAAHVVKDRAGAWDYLECSLRLADALRDEPLLISQLVRIAQLAVANEGFARGITAHAWTDDQLQTLQRRFETMDVVGIVPFALEGERAEVIQTMNQLIAQESEFRRLAKPGALQVV